MTSANFSNNDTICSDCAKRIYQRYASYATWYESQCISCLREIICTQVRDFKRGTPIDYKSIGSNVHNTNKDKFNKIK